MSKIHIHVQKQGMTWAGTPDEDRDRASRDTESCHRAIVTVLSRDRGLAVIDVGRDRRTPVVIVSIGDRVALT